MEGTTTAGPDEPLREVRLGLVFNGGVSLAVWMGGVTQEIDAARRAAAQPESTTGLYRALQHTMRQSVRVDVVSGASAGGINGALLAAAIATRQPVPSLRDTWIGLGDVSTLMRPPSQSDPPSWLKGNEVVLGAVRRKLEELLSAGPVEAADIDDPIYLYVTATNLRGRENTYRDSTGRPFSEQDSRHVFAFELLPKDHMSSRPPVGDTDTDADWPARAAGATSFTHEFVAQRLSDAARASSSFPGAFEAAGPLGPKHDWFIDGGVLDNQPFVPLLDRVAILPAAGRPVKRVVGYVVPYVNEPNAAATAPEKPAEVPSAMDTITGTASAMGSLSKLLSLDRLTADDETQRAEEAQRAHVHRLMVGDRPVLTTEGLACAAKALFGAYRRTRGQAGGETFARWRAASFVPGDGALGQDPAIAVGAIAAPALDYKPIDPDKASSWIPVDCSWNRSDRHWRWGLSPAERVATAALLMLRKMLEEDPQDDKLNDARSLASTLVWDIRALAQQLGEQFRRSKGNDATRAQSAYDALRGPGDENGRRWLQSRFVGLDTAIASACKGKSPRPQSVATLLHAEVVRNALRIDRARPPFPFDFVFMSAGVGSAEGINSALGHPFTSPDQKLTGMKLGHFGAFVKRSWRANDWLWGRMDGAVHVLRATIDPEYLAKVLKRGWSLSDDLEGFAFGQSADDEARGPLLQHWRDNIRRLEPPLEGSTRKEKFKDMLKRASANDRPALDLCHATLAAPLQLQILREELEVVAAAAEDDVKAGTSETVSGAVWAREVRAAKDRVADGCLSDEQLVRLFTKMKIGSEKLGDELLSKTGLDVTAQTAAVVTAILSGARGGLPTAIRGGLKGLRAATLSLSYAVRLLVRHPLAGAAAIALLAQLTYFAADSDAKRLGTLLPTLVMLCVVLLCVLLVVATNALEKPRIAMQFVAALAAAVVAPLAFGIALAFDFPHGARDLVVDTVTRWPTNVVAGLAIVAGVLGLVASCIFGSDESGTALRRARRVVNWERVVVLLAALVVAGGVLADRYRCEGDSTCNGWDWKAVADERGGIILGVGFLAVLLVAALVVELAAAARNKGNAS